MNAATAHPGQLRYSCQAKCRAVALMRVGGSLGVLTTEQLCWSVKG